MRITGLGVCLLGFALSLAAGTPAAGESARLLALSYIGGSSFDRAQGCAVGPDGSIYVAGNTSSTDLPATPGGLSTPRGGSDAFIARLSPDLSQVLALAYLGGSDEDRGYGLAVDPSGQVVAVGITRSSDFPATPGAFQTQRKGDVDVFVAKLRPDLSGLVWASLIGGSATVGTDTDWTRGGVQIGPDGSVTVVGKTAGPDFPTTPGAVQEQFAGGSWDAFVARFAPDGSHLLWSTLIGGSNGESFYGNLVLLPDGSVVVGGFSNSPDFPTTTGAWRRQFSGAQYPFFDGDGVVVHLSADGSQLLSSTYLWGGVSGNDGLAVDDAGRPWVHTNVRPENAGLVPVRPGAAQQAFAGGANDMVVGRLSADGSALEAATFLGGGDSEEPSGIALDAAGRAFVSGNTASTDLPITRGALQRRVGGGRDAFVAVLRPDLSLAYASYLGGPGTDRGRCVVSLSGARFAVTGDSDGGLPTTPGVFDSSPNGGRDGFIAVFQLGGEAP